MNLFEESTVNHEETANSDFEEQSLENEETPEEPNEDEQDDTETNEEPNEDDEKSEDSEDSEEDDQEDGDNQSEKVEFTPEQEAKFREAYFAQKQAERDAEALRQEVAALKAKIPAQQKKTLEDFDYDDDAYEEYMTNRVKSQLENDQAQTLNQQQQKMVDDWNKRATEYATEHPEYAELWTKYNSKMNYSPAIVDAVFEEGPKLQHHLLANPHLVDELSNMNPYHQAKKVADIMNKLNIKPTMKTSKAPDPAPKTKGKSRKTIDPIKDHSKLSTDEYIALRKKQLGNQKKGIFS